MEVNVTLSARGQFEGLCLPEGLFRVEAWPDHSGVSIEIVRPTQSTHIEHAIIDFIRVFKSVVSSLPKDAELRVAAYFSPDELAAFIVSLSADLVKLLADTGWSLEVAGFPSLEMDGSP